MCPPGSATRLQDAASHHCRGAFWNCSASSARRKKPWVLVKRAVHRGMQLDLAYGLEFETFLVTSIYGTEDKQEGISAFLEKRKAKFKGR